MQQSEIIHHKGGGVTLAGPDAVNLYRAVVLCSGLKFYAKTRMKLTRHATGPVMLSMATEYTGKTYKRGQYEQAAADVKVWIDTMKMALPVSES